MMAKAPKSRCGVGRRNLDIGNQLEEQPLLLLEAYRVEQQPGASVMHHTL